MDYIVLVKQVPDIRNIPPQAWDWEEGTLRRGLLDNVCNELDKQALAFALGMREKHSGEIVSLTMGPPFAEDVLRYALSVGPDTGVLLTDRKLGSGIIAAEAIFKAIEKQDFSKSTLWPYRELLDKSWVMRDIRSARNYRQVFHKAGRSGLYLGAPLSFVQQWIPLRLRTEADYGALSKAKLHRHCAGGIDRLTAVNLSGTTHREDEPPHITFSDATKCTGFAAEYGCHPCVYFCPAEVYKVSEGDVVLSPSNRVHCQRCGVKCPHQVIQWRFPRPGV